MKRLLTKLYMLTALLIMIFTPVYVYAQATEELATLCKDSSAKDSSLCKDYLEGKNQPSTNPVLELIKDIINIMFFLVGALAVIMVIYGGFKYVKGGGESNKINEAKSTIIYALVGVVVAFLADRLIIYMLNQFFN